jgi:5-hmdU DNA kinase-like protein
MEQSRKRQGGLPNAREDPRNGLSPRTPIFLAGACAGNIVSAAWNRLKTTVVFDTYWRLAAERQRIFSARLRSIPQPWTSDPILRAYKFTNSYRASDRVSQYLIRKVIYQGDQSPREVFFRTILFKFFNRIETWELIISRFGIPTFREYRFRDYDDVLSKAMNAGRRVYSAAYIMPSGTGSPAEFRKHQMHLRLLEHMVNENLPERLAECRTMQRAFELLKQYHTIGDFLAYQYVIDLNYGPILNSSEMDFVCAGPGAKDGIRKCFSSTSGLDADEIIKMMAERQEQEFSRLGIAFESLWGRSLQLIDCQNLFCEVDKYARIAHPEILGLTGRTRIKQKFKPNEDPIHPWYPPKWGINEKIENDSSYVRHH